MTKPSKLSRTKFSVMAIACLATSMVLPGCKESTPTENDVKAAISRDVRGHRASILCVNEVIHKGCWEVTARVEEVNVLEIGPPQTETYLSAKSSLRDPSPQFYDLTIYPFKVRLKMHCTCDPVGESTEITRTGFTDAEFKIAHDDKDGGYVRDK
jgi:hypothetical protein